MAVVQSAASTFFEHRPCTVGKVFPAQHEPDLEMITAIAEAVTAVNCAARGCGYAGWMYKGTGATGWGVLVFCSGDMGDRRYAQSYKTQ
jgi:hypothetical protein